MKNCWATQRHQIRVVCIALALSASMVAETQWTSVFAEDFFSPIDPPPSRLVSSPSWDQMATVKPTACNTPSGGDVFAVSPSCDGLFDPYLLESDVVASARMNGDLGVHDRGTLWQRVVSDHRNYYDLHSFKMLAGGFLIGAAIANTQLDQEIQNHFQASVRGATSDDWFESLHSSKELGNGRYTLPVFATAWAIGAYFDETPVWVTSGRWGERSLRSFLVGAPPLILTQRLTGGSRPGEKDRNSRWLPFQDNNGVSGHAFMSSLPFINAAKMTDRPLLKTAFYAGSLLGPLSRVNDDAHYPSQVALGWWMAYVAATAIDRTEIRNSNLTFYPYIANNGGTGGMFEWRF